MNCTHCGDNNDADALFCKHCGKPFAAKQQTAQPGEKQDFVYPKSEFQNNSGQGKLAAFPPQLYGWNWGAFFLTWMWGIGNNTTIAFLTWVPLANFVVPFMLGVKGNEWAWQNKRWKSIEHFQKVQKLWSLWGFILAILIMLSILIALIIAMKTF